MMNSRAKHGVDEVPILGCTDGWILTGSALAELIVPIYEEFESVVSEQRPHSASSDAIGGSAGLAELLRCAGKRADLAEIVERPTDGLRNRRVHCVADIASDAEHFT